MKQRKMKLSDVYVVNLHSTPENPKRYAPNPNLYAFFVALGIALLKDHGRLSYIIPQTMLFAGDLDVLRYHLAKFTKIEKVITFSGKMFIGRGLKQNKPIHTSSLIFVIERVVPPLLHKVEIINYNDPDSDVEEGLRDIQMDKKVTKSKILQSDLLKNVSNWNFIKQSKEFIDLYSEYKRVSEDISIYYNHVLASMTFKSKFFFDRGVKYPRNKVKSIRELNSVEYYFIPGKNKGVYFQQKSNLGIDRKLLDFPFGSQGEEVYRRKYKILWSYINYDRFRFSDENLVIDYNSVLITSDNKAELLFLFSLFNSKITQRILNALFRNENEKDILIGIKIIKEFIRVPRITDDNRYIKNLIINFTELLLDLEKLTLANLVDFSKLLKQKFEKISVEGSNLVLEKDGEQVELPIKRDALLVGKIIKTHYGQDDLGLEGETITLPELMSLPAIDFEKQKEIRKRYG